MPNCVEYLYCWFGLSELGAISVPINTAYRRDETAYILNNAEAVALVTDPSLADVAGAAADLAPGIRHRILRGDEPILSPSPLLEGGSNPLPEWRGELGRLDIHSVRCLR